MPMEWKKASPGMSALLERLIAPYGSEKRTMFGCPAYFVNGNMFAGVFADRIFLRLSAGDREELLGVVDEAEPFAPMKDRVMKEYIALPEPAVAERAVLEAWLDRSFRYARALPVKEKKSLRKG
jgi:TfoX/Sxy family transcriptional regulator of competence genes